MSGDAWKGEHEGTIAETEEGEAGVSGVWRRSGDRTEGVCWGVIYDGLKGD